MGHKNVRLLTVMLCFVLAMQFLDYDIHCEPKNCSPLPLFLQQLYQTKWLFVLLITIAQICVM